jgi:hypothetical protein
MRHPLFARAHASSRFLGLLSCLSCARRRTRRGRPAVTMPKPDAVNGRDGDTPICLGTALANPCYPGEVRGKEGGRDQLAARSQDEGNRVEEVAAHRFPLFPVDCSTPFPACPAGLLRDEGGGTASAQSLSCAEYSSACGGDGVATAVRTPSQPGRQAPHRRTAVRDGTPDAPRRRASGNYCA